MKDIIASRRKQLGYTQQQLAEKLNVSDKVVSKWETGRSLPDTSLLVDLAEVLEISVGDLLKSDTESRESVKEAFNTETNTKYKNLLIVTMAMQIVVALLIAIGKITIHTAQPYDYNKAETIYLVFMVLAVVIEIGAVTFFLVVRNNLLNKYPTSSPVDKEYINRLLFCTYPVALAVIIVFVVCHGLEIYEQIISSLIFGALALIPFAILYFVNKSRKL